MTSKRLNMKAILADPELRRKLMVATIQTTQAREGIDTTTEQADRAYYVVTESERAAFFDLVRFRENAGNDLRQLRFVEALHDDHSSVRRDVARRDFQTIDGCPIAFARVDLVAHAFRDHPALEPIWGVARQGKATGDDPRWVRYWWEVSSSSGWVPFAKGGEFCRFYEDVHLVIDWNPEHREALKSSGNGLPSEDLYFQPGLTWPRAASVFNVRILPPGCVFADKGPVVFPKKVENTWFLAGVLNSDMVLCFAKTLTSRETMGGRWEVGIVKRFPIPQGAQTREARIAAISEAIYVAKRDWDKGNETSTLFQEAWLCNAAGLNRGATTAKLLDTLSAQERSTNLQIQGLFNELNDEVFRLYDVPAEKRELIVETLGDRPGEVLWPHMEGKSVEQKRMEHIWRLLSYAVKRVIEAEAAGIVLFARASGEMRLVDRVRQELALLFPERDESQLEVEIVNELRQGAKGYRRCQSFDDWLENVFFDYHSTLYKGRPIFWHIGSAQGTLRFAFGALVHYHRFNQNGLAKLRSGQLRDAIEEFRREAGLADKDGRSEDRVDFQAKVEEAQALDKKLKLIQEGHHDGAEGGDQDFRILTPWKQPSTRPRGWDPDLDDGVKVNIAPFQSAGVLRVTGVAG
jgi:hypothetical protein